jgi:hypothetical protein
VNTPDSSSNKDGRDFLDVTKEMRFVAERRDEMKKGDYIDMKVNRFNGWPGIVESGDEVILSVSDPVRVQIVELLDDQNSILVEAGGVRKRVEGSLFYNFWKGDSD